MQDSIRSDILFRIKNDFGGRESTDAKFVRRIQCPSCGKKEAFTSMDAPWMLKCGRESKCGDQHHVKTLFPDLFDNWTDRYAPRDLKPGQKPSGTEVADAYMSHGRGFDLGKVAGWYSQETYWDYQRNISSTTVRFQINERDYWERLIDKPERFGKMKAHFNRGAQFKGDAWVPPGLDLSQVSELWIVEGIFDAIALYHAGIPAVAAFSCNNYPTKLLASLKKLRSEAGAMLPKIIWALDGDDAGMRYIRRFARAARSAGWKVGAAIIPQVGKSKNDWNDAWQRGELLSEDGEQLTKEFLYQGDLVIARSAGEKAARMFNHTGQREFPFGYGNRLFWFKLNMEEYQKAINELEDSSEALTDQEIRDKALQQCNAVVEIANCYPTFLYYLANPITDESWYYTRVDFPHDGRSVKNTFNGGQLASASEFKKRLLGIAPGAVWTGTSQQLDRLLKQQIGGIKTVETIDFIGYSKEHETWVFPELAVNAGNIYDLNEEDYYDIGRMSLKTLSASVSLSINSSRSEYRRDWALDLANCFGPKGVVALAFWLGSLFAEQIRAEHKSYPFIEIVGEAGSGKSTLIEFLWKLVGRTDYEGFDPNKSTAAGRSRNFAQVSNLPVSLIESDRDQEGGNKQKQFDWDELKTLYNGRSLRARGLKTSGNETYEPPFRGSVIISQNAQVEASDAILQRIVHLKFTREGHTPATKALAIKLESTPMENVSGFVLQATTSEAKLMEMFFEAAPAYEQALSEIPEIRILRIAKNHGQLMALVDCLGEKGLKLLPESYLEPARQMVQAMALERQGSVNSDHPLVQEFWEAYDYIEGQSVSPTLNHYGDDRMIAINLKHFEQVCAENKLSIPRMSELKRYLKTSRARKFIDSSRTVRSAIRRELNHTGSDTVRCWIFEKEK
ncbi:toprim domain-containing protein [Marinobacter sp. X15-166B]|uniref:toprim domain-containing protein n=1 Tax=Marinobacter sp. X15-166B TaxID=1897620 RepID=UPI00085C7F34|nr:toprim domain-containing protein [Marinobacter sp. X15-166B]OEY67441.1 toprim domain protein [Marinobacter sp. X15-166B]